MVHVPPAPFIPAIVPMIRNASVAALLAVIFPTSAAPAQEVVELPAQDRALEADFVEVYSVAMPKSDDPEPESPFGDFADFTKELQLAFNPAGELLVFEKGLRPQTGRIVVFGVDGAVAREFGRMGWERGDFRAPVNFGVLSDGRSVVKDREHSAFLVYAPDGAYERMVRFPRPSGGILTGMVPGLPGLAGLAERVAAGRDGAFVYRTVLSDMDMDIDEQTFSVQTLNTGPTGIVERVGLEGNRVTVDTALRAWRPSEGEATSIGVQMNPDITQLSEEEMAFADMSSLLSMDRAQTAWLFPPPFAFGVLPDNGLAYIDSTTWEVKLVDADGRLNRIVRRPLTPTPVTEEMRAEIGTRIREAQSAALDGIEELMPSDEAAVMDGLLAGLTDQVTPEFFPEVPVLSGLGVGWDGALWVVRTGDLLSMFESESDLDATILPGGIGGLSAPAGGPIDIVGADDTYAGTLPAGTKLPDAFGPDGLAAWVTIDADLSKTIVVRRIPAALRLP